MGFSFTVMLSAAVALSSAASWCGSFTVNAQRCAAGNGTLEAPRRNRRDTLLLFVITGVNVGTNSLYIIINMPLFIINELHLPELAGMMGTAAGLEIPTMLMQVTSPNGWENAC